MICHQKTQINLIPFHRLYDKLNEFQIVSYKYFCFSTIFSFFKDLHNLSTMDKQNEDDVQHYCKKFDFNKNPFNGDMREYWIWLAWILTVIPTYLLNPEETQKAIFSGFRTLGHEDALERFSFIRRIKSKSSILQSQRRSRCNRKSKHSRHLFICLVNYSCSMSETLEAN